MPPRSSGEETALAALYPELRKLSSCIFSDTSLSLDLSILVAQFALPNLLWVGVKLQETRPEPKSLRGSLLAKSFETREDAVKWTGAITSFEVLINRQCRRSDGLWSTFVATAYLRGHAMECSYGALSQHWTDESDIDSIVVRQQLTNTVGYFDAMEKRRLRHCVCLCVLCTRHFGVHCTDCFQKWESTATEIANGITREELISRAEVIHGVKLHSPPFLVLNYHANALRLGAVQTSQ